MGRLCWVKPGIIDFSSLYLRPLRPVAGAEKATKRAICFRRLLLNRFDCRVIAVIKLASKARGYIHT